METRTRSIAKTISWRIIATAVTIFLAFIWLHQWTSSILLGIVVNGVKAVLYYVHERGWNLLRWGRAGRPNPRGGFTLWFTGLPCSGKSTIADAVAEELRCRGLKVERLDGDIIRKHLWKELGFSREDREENIRRVTYLAKMLTRNGVVVLTSFISPYRAMRESARKEIGDFLEVYVKCPVEVCMQRDVKGMYKRALAGEIPQFTGVSDPYEEPTNPDILLESDRLSPQESVREVMEKLKAVAYI